MLTKQEEDLFKRLSNPPKCMHDPKFIEYTKHSWKCGVCGLIARKTIPCGEVK